MLVKKLASLALSVTLGAACGSCRVDRSQGTNPGEPGLELGLGDTVVSEDIGSDLRELAQSRIYFGRHSVGRNILSGLELLAEEHGAEDIHIVELDIEDQLPATFFAHSRVGENRHPKDKVDDFARRIRGGLPVKPDVAFMKFCYVDIDPHTNVRELFDYYRSALDGLSEEFPDVDFVHATVPLMTRNLGPKERLKLLLGQKLWGDEANARREQFNGLLRQNYDQSRIIDIARVESMNPDETQEQFTMDGEQHPALSPAYTNDGGHLNEAGQRKVAAEMIRVLAHNIRRNE
jgi:hypothetical protein